MHNHNPVWSPDGQWIYFVHGSEPTDDMDVWRVRPSGGTPERLTQQHAAVNFLAPLDARTLLYVARAEDRSGPWLWALDVESKVTRRVSSGLEQYTSVSASRDGRASSPPSPTPAPACGACRCSIGSPRIATSNRTALPTARALAPRFGGTSLFYLSARGTRRRALAGPGRTGVRSLEGRGRRVVRAAGGVAGRAPRGRRRQTGGEAASGDHVGGRHERTNVGRVHRHARSGRPGHGGLVAGRRLDRDRRQ